MQKYDFYSNTSMHCQGKVEQSKMCPSLIWFLLIIQRLPKTGLNSDLYQFTIFFVISLQPDSFSQYAGEILSSLKKPSLILHILELYFIIYYEHTHDYN